MKIKSAKAKGRRLQNKVRQDLIDSLGLDPDMIRTRIMGEAGEDIVDVTGTLGLSIECKNTESLNIWKALEQAEQNKKEGTDSCVVFKRNKSKVYIALSWEKFLQIFSAYIRLSKSPL